MGLPILPLLAGGASLLGMLGQFGGLFGNQNSNLGQSANAGGPQVPEGALQVDPVLARIRAGEGSSVPQVSVGRRGNRRVQGGQNVGRVDPTYALPQQVVGGGINAPWASQYGIGVTPWSSAFDLGDVPRGQFQPTTGLGYPLQMDFLKGMY